jgi:hypothetical protein
MQRPREFELAASRKKRGQAPLMKLNHISPAALNANFSDFAGVDVFPTENSRELRGRI